MHRDCLIPRVAVYGNLSGTAGVYDALVSRKYAFGTGAFYVPDLESIE